MRKKYWMNAIRELSKAYIAFAGRINVIKLLTPVLREQPRRTAQPYPGGASVLAVRIIELTGELEAWEKEWNALLSSTENDAVYLTHEWMLAWWKSFGTGKKLHVLMVCDAAGAVIGIAPCMRSRSPHYGMSLDTIEFLANGYSPSAAVIARERDLHCVVEAVLAHFEKLRSWDILKFHKVEEDSLLYPLLLKHMQSRFAYGIKGDIESPYIPIDTDWDSFLRTRSAKFRKVMRNKINRAEKAGGLAVHRVSIKSGSDPEIQDMIDISGRSWKKKVGSDLETSDPGKKFLRELGDLLGPKGMVTLWILKKGTVPIAYEFHLVYGKIAYPLRADYDERFSELSPGSFLEWHILKILFQESTLNAYYSCGHTYRYLLKWTGKTSRHVTMEVFRNKTIPQGLHAFEYRFLPVLRKMKLNKIKQFAKVPNEL